MISWRVSIVLHCVVWFFYNPQQIHMLFQSCLWMMPLFTASCSLAPLWGFSGWTPSSVFSPSYWFFFFLLEVYFLFRFHLIYDSTEIFYSCLNLSICVFFPWGAVGAPHFDVFCLNNFTLTFFVLSLVVCFCFESYHHSVVAVSVSSCW